MKQVSGGRTRREEGGGSRQQGVGKLEAGRREDGGRGEGEASGKTLDNLSLAYLLYERA